MGTAGGAPERGIIRLLDEQVAGRIAAGEVIDRPVSIVRELLDNAIDAGAGAIDVELHSGGLGLVAVRDDGRGIGRADLERVALRHATSKISDERDLQRVTTLGFRGEALASIAACALLEVTSRAAGEARAARLVAGAGGRRVSAAGAAPGTRVQVTRLFAELPARRRFLRRPGAETTLCRRMVQEKALAHPAVTFRLTVDGQADTALPAADQRQRVADALGVRFRPHDLFQAQRRFADFRVAVIGARPELAGRDRSRLLVFVNRRRIQQFALAQAVEYGYAALLPGGRHPVACLFVEIEPHLVDFNVHPAKREVRFRNLAPLHQAVVRVVQEVVPQFGHRSPLAAPAPPPAEGPGLPYAAPAAPRPPASRGASYGPNRSPLPAPAGAPYGSNRPPPPAPAGTEIAESPLGAAPAPPPAAASPPAALPAAALPLAAAPVAEPHAAAPDPGAGMRYVGQTLGLFLLVEIGPTLYFVDQHAAHERVLYEDLRRRAFAVQRLLLPIELEPAAAAATAPAGARARLRELGIVIEQEAGGPARVTALAEPLHQLPAEWLARYLAGMRGSEADLERAVLADFACKLAVKDGEVLDDAAATTIVRRSFAIDLQHCPHGRPLWYSVARQQLVKEVGR